jgi:hypothetical protein
MWKAGPGAKCMDAACDPFLFEKPLSVYALNSVLPLHLYYLCPILEELFANVQ